MKIIDVHCHIDQYNEEQLKKILLDDEVNVVGAAINEDSGKKLIKIKEEYPDTNICLGIHPEYPDHYDEFDAVKKQIYENVNQIVAIGEIGLPYYTLEKMTNQEKTLALAGGKTLLSKFLDLAEILHLPVILHAIEETASYVYEELKTRKLTKALFHWFEGDLSTLRKIVDAGYHISVSPDVLHNRKYAEFVRHIPLDSIVLESDGPWVYNDQMGIPNMVLDVAEYLSKDRGLTKDELLNKIYKNSCELFEKIL